MTEIGGRAAHYRDFYGGSGSTSSEPLWLIMGNCQAEALRLVLDAVPDRPYRTVRTPPVHELAATDLPHLEALLARTSVLACQPIRPDYRDLPIGTGQLAARIPRSATVVRWPVIRYAGLYPFQVIVRHPADRSVVPPAVPYHDLRTIVGARDGRTPQAPWDVDVSAAQIVAAAEASRAELARREQRDTDVGVSDVLMRFGADAAHTINHPGNSVLVELGRRILASQGVAAPVPAPPRTLLRSVHAPLEARVLEALRIDAAPRACWTTELGPLSPQDVHATQMRWYADNPDYIELALQRHAATAELLGLTGRRVRR
ncbi:WcbI family polysaccharide biosynthesis putative acetyltransferase [Mycolicibacterium arseniciresistens]|uniref:WcbI family polysaccharide biosynthesis putative acetyltransferase n=1 Tax=Mycolicibacterium arseniciresistens TaxID=3062257 RepID=A0ABT8UIE3_9MYCO|nr:WcbI family polysaccharide biosynthesis putative acetyltransferase [Mycolicibacterium arseniciresistens]MDO3636163.1 WcbI family polysaccharide biosynthesis putative acetyltransferase [Mycolicibacterium arseniciresistens]